MAMLEINHLQKKFGTTEVLRDVSLSVSKGDVVAILGPSGSGKTTLLRCVNLLERADAGELLFDDEKFDLNRASHRDIARIRQKTAFVFQNYNLFRNKTALQNVTEGLIVARKMKKAEAEGKKVGIICTEESQDMYQGGNLEVIGSREHEETVAHNLFAVLRDFDARKVDCIFSESFSKDQLGQAIMNRLCKAAGYHIVNI